MLERIADRIIDRLNQLDGDWDLEDSETSGPNVDDRGRYSGPGCGVDFLTEDDEPDDEDMGVDDDPRGMDDDEGRNFPSWYS
jgi:hypothetical protein